MNLLFAPPSSLPQGVGFPAFGAAHLIWLAAMGLGGILACLHFRRLDQPGRDRFLKGYAMAIVVFEVIRDLIYWIIGDFHLGLLPLHLCGIGIFIMLFAAFRPSPFVRQLLYNLILPAGMAALLFPDWTAQPPLHFSSIWSFLYHGMAVVFVLLLLTGGMLRPDWRFLPKSFAFLLCFAAPLFFLNKLWGTNFFFLNYPVEGTPLTALAGFLGNPGYIVGVAALFWMIWLLMHLPWQLAHRAKAKT